MNRNLLRIRTFFNTIEGRIEYIKSLQLPVCLIYQGDYGSSLALLLLNRYYGAESYRVYVTLLPCHNQEYREGMNNFLDGLHNTDIKIIDCGEDCVPLGSDRQPVTIREYPYYGACSQIRPAIVKDYWPGSFVNIFPGEYIPSEIKTCHQYNHCIPDEYGLVQPHNGNEVITNPDSNYSFYLFYGLAQDQIRMIANGVGFYKEVVPCWDVIDKNSMECYKASNPEASAEILSVVYEGAKQSRRTLLGRSMVEEMG